MTKKLKEKLIAIGFDYLTNINPNPRKVDHALRNGGVILYPNENGTYLFCWEAGCTTITSVKEAKDLVKILTGRKL